MARKFCQYLFTHCVTLNFDLILSKYSQTQKTEDGRTDGHMKQISTIFPNCPYSAERFTKYDAKLPKTPKSSQNYPNPTSYLDLYIFFEYIVQKIFSAEHIFAIQTEIFQRNYYFWNK